MARLNGTTMMTAAGWRRHASDDHDEAMTITTAEMMAVVATMMGQWREGGEDVDGDRDNGDNVGADSDNMDVDGNGGGTGSGNADVGDSVDGDGDGAGAGADTDMDSGGRRTLQTV
ncbi:hypothetical protein EDB85DRAFT_1899150 [Lactarius pseudohatsudake]|nr:hypothetical protein EDB85DRAFT_1899150 [Lactarius pseudohatsudake]